jgi:DNA (cytosine-5)-methyltransferase 1
MDVSGNIIGTLRANAKNHQPLVFENNGADARYNQAEQSPTLTARLGTGGNNVPLVADGGSERDNTPLVADSGSETDGSQPEGGETYCIAGNTIGREPENGGNGAGWQAGLAYTVTAADRHAIYNRQGYADFSGESSVAATQTAHQAKDATDLVRDTYQQTQYSNYAESTERGAKRSPRQRHGSGAENLVRDGEPDGARRLIRRLTPLECESLQGFPDGWTDIPGASDSARYKALGNSVAIPCVELVMRGIAYFLQQIYDGTESVNYD